MAMAVMIALAIIAASYLFLRIVLLVTQDAKEPPVILTRTPFLAPLIGMISEKGNFHVRLRDKYNLPIYTLRMPFSRTYVVNDTSLIPAFQKQWRTISFAAHARDVGWVMGMSEHAIKTMNQDLTSDQSYGISSPRLITPIIAPGKDLDVLSRASIKVLVDSIDCLRRGDPDTGAPVVDGLWQWTRRSMNRATTEAVWGPMNPYRDDAVLEAWTTFEAGFLTLSVLPMPWLLIPRLFRAREIVAAAMIDYIRGGGHEKATSFVRALYEHSRDRFGFSVEDVGRSQLGLTFGVLGNSTPCALWLLYHIFSDQHVLSNVRAELEALVSCGEEQGVLTKSIDLANIRASCPILLSTLHETMRYRTVNPGFRKILEDVTIDRWLLKKGSILMIPTTVQHTSVAAWGETAGAFDHRRFVARPEDAVEAKRPFNRVAFRAFGGGHNLCPGRHFASNELMALAALVVLQFDIVPINGGGWPSPTWKKSPITAGFPIIDEDIEVDFRPRDSKARWNVTFSGSGEAMVMASEDLSAEIE